MTDNIRHSLIISGRDGFLYKKRMSVLNLINKNYHLSLKTSAMKFNVKINITTYSLARQADSLYCILNIGHTDWLVQK